MTEKTIADKLAIEPQHEDLVSDVVELHELDGSGNGHQLPTGAEMNASSPVRCAVAAEPER